MTRDFDAFEFAQQRPLGFAALSHLRAAWVKAAARWRVEGVGHLTLHGRAGTAGVVHFRNRVEQHAGVGMLRVGKQGVLVGQFH